MKLNYIIIPMIMLITMFLGSRWSRKGMRWYHNPHALKLGQLTPPDWIFAPVWSLIFVLTTIFTIVFWNNYEHSSVPFWLIITLLIINIVCNVFWSYLFFNQHALKAAFLDAIILTITVYCIIGICSYYYSFTLSLLLIPYALWGTFACYLNYQICKMNK